MREEARVAFTADPSNASKNTWNLVEACAHGRTHATLSAKNTKAAMNTHVRPYHTGGTHAHARTHFTRFSLFVTQTSKTLQTQRTSVQTTCVTSHTHTHAKHQATAADESCTFKKTPKNYPVRREHLDNRVHRRAPGCA